MKSRMKAINLAVFRQIEKYFKKDHSYKTIIQLLEKEHGFSVTLRSLERILRFHKLKRKNIDESEQEEIAVAILLELRGGGRNLGYRAMWKRLRNVYELRLKQKTVLELLHMLNPEGVERRSRYRLKRRVYRVPGPNFIWHADGHDKLKRYGFAIYGIIDGFSRKILSLKVATSNNNPRIIGHYYLQLIKKKGYSPTIIRTDHGTEVIDMEDLHVALRADHADSHAGEHSFLKGKSTHNQRIESYWRLFRQGLGDFYIHLFRGMEEAQILDVTNHLHIEILRFCYGHLIQYEIENARKEWNEHRIRKQNNRDVLAGLPNEMFNCPENYGALDYSRELNCSDVSILMEKYTEEPRLYSEAFGKFVEDIPGASVPIDAESAFMMYHYLIDYFHQFQ